MYIRHSNRAGIYLTFSEEANGAYLCKSIGYNARVLGGCQGVVMQLQKCFQCFSVSFFSRLPCSYLSVLIDFELCYGDVRVL